jgi:hypothetical protein
MLADGGIDALDPEGAEIPLLDLAVARCVLHRAIDGSLCSADGVLATAVKALGGLQNLLMLGARGNASFYT